MGSARTMAVQWSNCLVQTLCKVAIGQNGADSAHWAWRSFQKAFLVCTGQSRPAWNRGRRDPDHQGHQETHCKEHVLGGWLNWSMAPASVSQKCKDNRNTWKVQWSWGSALVFRCSVHESCCSCAVFLHDKQSPLPKCAYLNALEYHEHTKCFFT